jgi:hypothetical protein
MTSTRLTAAFVGVSFLSQSISFAGNGTGLPWFVYGNTCPEPEAPPSAKASEASGDVALAVFVRDGMQVDRIEIRKSSGPTKDHKQLDQAVVNSIANCKIELPLSPTNLDSFVAVYKWPNSLTPELTQTRGEFTDRKFTYMFERTACAQSVQMHFLASPHATAPLRLENSPLTFVVRSAVESRSTTQPDFYTIEFESTAKAYVSRRFLEMATESRKFPTGCIFQGDKSTVLLGMQEQQDEAVNREKALEKSVQEAKFQAARPAAKLGMTARQVVERTWWGRPTQINKTVSKGGTKEQWVYPEANYLYFVNGRLTSIQTAE